MNFFDVIKSRRSIRKYLNLPVPDGVVEQALDCALLAPNSSNLQTWEFFWVQSPEKKSALVQACLNQNAARSAQHLIVSVASPHLWKQNRDLILDEYKKESSNIPPVVIAYYTKWVDFLYTKHYLSYFKKIYFFIKGLKAPTIRRPSSSRDIEEVAIKSCALACQNFMLAITAQGFDTCPMEGFDEVRVTKLLGLKSTSRVVMVISVGKRDEKAVWGKQFRADKKNFIKIV